MAVGDGVSLGTWGVITTAQAGSGYFPIPPVISTSGLGDIASVNGTINAILVSATAVTGVGDVLTPICDSDGEPVPIYDNFVPKEDANVFPRIVFYNLPGGKTGRVFGWNNVEQYPFQLSVFDNYFQGNPQVARRIIQQAILALELATKSGFTMSPDHLISILRHDNDASPGQEIDVSASTIHLHVDMRLEVQRIFP